MSKILNGIIVVVMIALIATFVVSAVSIQSQTTNILSTYAARREELATRQQQIQDMILTLNATLQNEMINQQAIATELGIQVNNTNITPPVNSVTAPPVIVPTTPVVSTPVQQPVVTPTPVSQPVVVRRTRAS